MDSAHFALPLYSLIRKPEKADEKSLPDALADQLQGYLENSFNIKCLSAKFLIVKEEPYLLLQEVEKESVPALCSLADVQQSTLLKYERKGEDEATLTPVLLSPGD